MSRQATLDTVCTDSALDRAAPVIAVGLFDVNASGVPAHTEAVPLGTGYTSWQDLCSLFTRALAHGESHGPLPTHAVQALTSADRIDAFTRGARFERDDQGLALTTEFDSLKPSNGDPLVVTTTTNPVQTVSTETPSIATLGTGFDGWAHLRSHLDLATQTGDSTIHIPSDAANILHHADLVDAYTLGAELSLRDPDTPAASTE